MRKKAKRCNEAINRTVQKKTLAPNVKCDMRVYNNNSNDFLIKISDNNRGQKAPDTVIETKVV